MTGKLKIAICFLLATLAYTAGAQVATDTRTEEYATVRAIVSGLTGKFSTETTLPNPFLEMEGGAMELKDFVKDPKGLKFETLTDMLNYMNKFSWLLVTSSTVQLRADKPTSDFILYYTFKRKPKTK